MRNTRRALSRVSIPASCSAIRGDSFPEGSFHTTSLDRDLHSRLSSLRPLPAISAVTGISSLQHDNLCAGCCVAFTTANCVVGRFNRPLGPLVTLGSAALELRPGRGVRWEARGSDTIRFWLRWQGGCVEQTARWHRVLRAALAGWAAFDARVSPRISLRACGL